MAHRVRRQGALACSSRSGVRPTWTSISSPMSTSLHKPAERCRGGAPLALFVVPYDRLILERSKATVTTRLLGQRPLPATQMAPRSGLTRRSSW
jgi:hypothetical protein